MSIGSTIGITGRCDHCGIMKRIKKYLIAGGVHMWLCRGCKVNYD